MKQVLLVPKRCHEIRIIKIQLVKMHIIWLISLLKVHKICGEMLSKYREGGRTVGSGSVASIIE